MIFVGVDPGASGSVAVLSPGTQRCMTLKETERDLWDFLKTLPTRCKAVLERVSAMPGQGVTSMFRFGQSYGLARGFLIASGLSFELVSPVTWQKVFSLPSLKKAGSRTAKKNAHKARAQELFPGVKVTHANADALLLAEWLRRKES